MGKCSRQKSTKHCMPLLRWRPCFQMSPARTGMGVLSGMETSYGTIGSMLLNRKQPQLPRRRNLSTVISWLECMMMRG